MTMIHLTAATLTFTADHSTADRGAAKPRIALPGNFAGGQNGT